MLSIQNDFSNFDRVDWSTTYEVSIRFLIELLAHTYGKSPEQIIESLCLCSEDLPTFRYEEKESDHSNDPQWILLRYRTVLHTRVLLSNMLESSSWDRVPNSSISCREEIKYKGATYPDASVVETIFETRDENSGVSEVSVFKQMEQMCCQAKRVFCSSFSYYAACRWYCKRRFAMVLFLILSLFARIDCPRPK